MHPTAQILESEDHEFVSANQLDDYYAEEDRMDPKEAKKQRLTKGMGPKTELQNFYKDQCVFLTGGTGFLGKVLLEKMLRACIDIDTIYVLIRSKKGKDAKMRLDELLNDFLFSRAHKENPKGRHKVVPIVGDMTLPDLGISPEDRKLLIERVTIIINSAATLKFDEKLHIATAINVRGTKAIIQLAKDCRNLKAITHVSTAYSNSYLPIIEEKFYEPPMAVEALEAISELDPKLLDDITPTLLGKYPNTYCFTKAIAEEAVRKYGEGMPICVVRPSIVISTYEEPVRGWTCSVYGPTGLSIGLGIGVVRTLCLDLDKVADLVPVDLTVNAILASAWYTAKHFKENQISNIPIYNYVSGAQNPITWGKFVDLNTKLLLDKPTTKAVWYFGFTPTKNQFTFHIYNFLYHFLPALFIDIVCTLLGKERGRLKLYNKVVKIFQVLFYFTLREWIFRDDGVREMWKAMSEEDQVVFPFSISEMSWDYHLEIFVVGLRVYIVKDDLSTLPEARKKWRRLYYLHQLTKVILFCVAVFLVYSLFRIIAKFFI